MSAAWQAGHAILAERQARLPAALARVLADDTSAWPVLDGVVVTTGVGSSLAHARYLSWLLRERCGVSSWDVPTGAFVAPPGPAAAQQTLVIFSQGLSPNARLPLEHIERYRRVVLVTAADDDGPARAAVARDARARGVVVVPLGCAPEYEVLIRFEGPLLGYARAVQLANLAGAGIDTTGLVDVVTAAAAAGEALLTGLDPAIFSEPITLVGSGGSAALFANLAAKIFEGLYLPPPATVDVLELAHGTLQQAWPQARTFIALGNGGPFEAASFARARATLAPHHRWLSLPSSSSSSSSSSAATAIFEHELLLNALVLAGLRHRRLDQREWPGKGKDGPLYDIGGTAWLAAPSPSSTPSRAPSLRVSSRRLQDLTWPEIEQQIAAGCRTVVVPLGAIEQHGPHLPLDVDSVVAEALADRFCARVPTALSAPVIQLGCSVEHLEFSGTVSLSSSTLAAVIGDVIASLVSHGFEHVVVFSAHGGNDGTLAASTAVLRERAGAARLTVVHGIDDIARLWQRASADEGIDAAVSGAHAGEFETSIIAALRPESIRRHALRAGIDGDIEDPQTLFYPGLRRHAPEGVVGDPRAASATRAERYLAAWTEHLVSAAMSTGASSM